MRDKPRRTFLQWARRMRDKPQEHLRGRLNKTTNIAEQSIHINAELILYINEYTLNNNTLQILHSYALSMITENTLDRKI